MEPYLTLEQMQAMQLQQQLGQQFNQAPSAYYQPPPAQSQPVQPPLQPPSQWGNIARALMAPVEYYLSGKIGPTGSPMINRNINGPRL